MQLTKIESDKLRTFFNNNLMWMKNNSLLDEKNLKKFLKMIEQYMVDNNLIYSRTLMMFLMDIKGEVMEAHYTFGNKKAKDRRESITDNPKIEKWFIACNTTYKEKPINKNDGVNYDYSFYEEKIEKARKRVLEKKNENNTMLG